MRHGFVALLLVFALSAQGLSGTPEPSKSSIPKATIENHDAAAKLAQKAMDQLKTHGISAFLDLVFAGNAPWLKKELRTNNEYLFTHLHSDAITQNGKPLGEIELVRTATLGQSVVRFVYAEKFERKAMLWTLTFYHGEKEWQLVDFNLTDQFDGEFRTAKLGETKHQGAAALADKGAKALKAGGVPKLFDAAHVQESSALTNNRANIESQFVTLHNNTAAIYGGKATGEIDLCRVEEIGNSLVQFIYLEKYESGAIIWKFTFYRAGREWKWINLNLVGDYKTALPARP